MRKGQVGRAGQVGRVGQVGRTGWVGAALQVGPVAAIAAAAILCALAVVSAQPRAVEGNVDRVFAKWTADTPGCAVGVAARGKTVLAKGYGTADLEHDVRISPETIFEAGSVSKQFTAAAILQLAHDGRLSLDDPVRTYVPELPEYDTPILIRHMLTHTSGLRDWGSIAAIAGWPRTTRAHTHAHVLEIVHRQTALNFPPGTRWSYSNTGFNLAAIIVERVSGTSFQAFTRARLFDPLGMAHTSWRDDYTRIVKGRAIAYRERDKTFATDMPFENVYGNGGLLTTVGDLLKWNEHYDAPPEGDAPMVAEQQKAGHFNDGRAHGYGLGLFVGSYKGLREISHSGSTAGYQAFLTRFPDQRVSVAVLCNVATAQATQYAHAVADVYLGDRVKSPAATPTHTLTSAEMDRFAGMWKSDVTELPITIGRDNDGLFTNRTMRLQAESPTRLLTGEGAHIDLDARGLRHTDAYGTVEEYSRVQPATYTDDQLARFAGTFVSDEAETTLTAAVENHALVLKRRPDTTIALTPLYMCAFNADHGLGTVVFRMDGSGRASELSVIQDRVWNLPFRKLEVRSQK